MGDFLAVKEWLPENSQKIGEIRFYQNSWQVIIIGRLVMSLFVLDLYWKVLFSWLASTMFK